MKVSILKYKREFFTDEERQNKGFLKSFVFYMGTHYGYNFHLREFNLRQLRDIRKLALKAQ